MGVEDRFQMTLVESQVQSAKSISNVRLLVNFFTGVGGFTHYEGGLWCQHMIRKEPIQLMGLRHHLSK